MMLVVDDFAKHVHAEGLAPLHEMIQSFRELGGVIMVCTPSLRSRNMSEEQLPEGTKTVAAATVIQESAVAAVVLTY